MKRTVITILISVVITSLGWSLVSGLQQGVDRLWLLSAVKAPGRMALSNIEADLVAGRFEIAKAKLSAFQKEWAIFENESGFRGIGIGNIMVTLGQIDSVANTNKNHEPDSTKNLR